MTDYNKQYWFERQEVIDKFNFLRNKYHAYCKLMNITPESPKYPFEDMTHATLLYKHLCIEHKLIP